MRVLLERHITLFCAVEANGLSALILRAHNLIRLRVNDIVVACVHLVDMVDTNDAMAASQHGLEVA